MATILSTLTVGTLAAAQDDVAPQAVVLPPEPPRDQPREAPPSAAPAVGGEGRWVFDVLGGQLGGPAPGLGATSAVAGSGFVGPFTISTISNESDPAGLHASYKSILLALTPSVDAFVTEHFSIGGQVGVGVLTSRSVQQQAPTSTLPGVPPPPDSTSWMRGYTGTPTVSGPSVPGTTEAFGGSMRASLRLDL
jgi:hypothetical protein